MNESGDRPREPQGKKWADRAKAVGQKGAGRIKGALTRAGFQLADTKPELPATEPVNPKEAFVSVATKHLDAVRNRLSRIDQIKELVPADEQEARKREIMLFATASNARGEFIRLLDCLYPPETIVRVNEERFSGIRNIQPEDIGVTPDDLHQDAVKITKTTIDTLESNRQKYKDLDKSEEDSWFFGTRDVFFPWHEFAAERGGNAIWERQSYVSILDLLDVIPEDIGMTQEQWDGIKVKYFQTWFKNRDNPDYHHWGGCRSGYGLLYNNIRPIDIAPDELEGKIADDGSCDEETQRIISEIDSLYFVGNNVHPVVAENFQGHIEKEGRPGHINPNSNSPVWGSTPQT